MTTRTAIVVFPGVEELDFVAPFEVLSAARRLGAELVIALDALEPEITAFHGMRITGLATLESADACDLVVVPGGAWLAGGNTGVRAAVAEGRIAQWLRARHARGAVIASVCTGVFLLAEAGLLAGRRAATHHSAKDDLASYEGVALATGRVVDAGDIVTAGGVTSGLDLALRLVERFCGPELARKTEDYLEYESRA
jgi:transcriptional regulator GlxA family with amidase domain